MRLGGLVACLLPLALASAAAGERAPDDVLGRWWLPGREGQLEIYAEGGRYFGRVTAFEGPPTLDANNPDPALRHRPLVGIQMFGDFRFDAAEGRWQDGTIYDFRGGRTYRCRLWFEDGEDDVLWARGFFGISLFGRTVSFARVR